jgi:hypothetical protein
MQRAARFYSFRAMSFRPFWLLEAVWVCLSG